MGRIKIGLVDDHTIVCDGLKAMFFGSPEIDVVGSFNNGRELFVYLKSKSIDLVLLDISMPGLTGTEVARILGVRFPNIKVIMLSALTDTYNIEASIKAGARGFLNKETNKDELLKAINVVSSGEYYFSAGNIESVYNNYVKHTAKSQPPGNNTVLTDRELEIVRLFADGMLYKEVADLLSISIKTVEAHKANIMRKLEINSTAALVKYAIREKIITF